MGCRDGRRRVEFESGSSSLDLTGVVSGLENFQSWVRMIWFFFFFDLRWICAGLVMLRVRVECDPSSFFVYLYLLYLICKIFCRFEVAKV